MCEKSFGRVALSGWTLLKMDLNVILPTVAAALMGNSVQPVDTDRAKDDLSRGKGCYRPCLHNVYLTSSPDCTWSHACLYMLTVEQWSKYPMIARSRRHPAAMDRCVRRHRTTPRCLDHHFIPEIEMIDRPLTRGVYCTASFVEVGHLICGLLAINREIAVDASRDIECARHVHRVLPTSATSIVANILTYTFELSFMLPYQSCQRHMKPLLS